MKTKYYIIITFLLMFISTNLFSQQDTTNKWYIPKSIRFQFAGNIGKFSVGPSWTFFKNKLELTSSIGYVPEYSGGKNIYISAAKAIYTPKLDINIKNFKIKPISVGVVYAHTFGESYWKYQTSETYPDGYYWWNVSNRFGLIYDIEVFLKIKKKHLKGLSIYFETCFWDLYLFSKFDNSNSKYFKIFETTTFGLGLKVYL